MSALPTIDTTQTALIAGYLRGKRREKFELAISLLRDAIANEGWTIPRASSKVQAGLYQGLLSGVSRQGVYRYWYGERFALAQCLCFGRAVGRPVTAEELAPTGVNRPQVSLGAPLDVAQAWIALCDAVHAAIAALDAARPRPVITPIGLSPKVTKTLTECNLDLELSSIKPAKIAFYERHMVIVPKDGAAYCAIDPENGQPVLEKVYYPAWTLGIKHKMSRFHSGCEACGKHIPSGRFVPIEAWCKRNGLISMWLGCDCARNIFGIKDVGVAREGST